MAALLLIAIAGLGYAAHAAAHGDWSPLVVFSFCSAVYAVMWALDAASRRPARPARKFRSF